MFIARRFMFISLTTLLLLTVWRDHLRVACEHNTLSSPMFQVRDGENVLRNQECPASLYAALKRYSTHWKIYPGDLGAQETWLIRTVPRVRLDLGATDISGGQLSDSLRHQPQRGYRRSTGDNCLLPVSLKDSERQLKEERVFSHLVASGGKVVKVSSNKPCAHGPSTLGTAGRGV